MSCSLPKIDPKRFFSPISFPTRYDKSTLHCLLKVKRMFNAKVSRLLLEELEHHNYKKRKYVQTLRKCLTRHVSSIESGLNSLPFYLYKLCSNIKKLGISPSKYQGTKISLTCINYLAGYFIACKDLEILPLYRRVPAQALIQIRKLKKLKDLRLTLSGEEFPKFKKLFRDLTSLERLKLMMKNWEVIEGPFYSYFSRIFSIRKK